MHSGHSFLSDCNDSFLLTVMPLDTLAIHGYYKSFTLEFLIKG